MGIRAFLIIAWAAACVLAKRPFRCASQFGLGSRSPRFERYLKMSRTAVLLSLFCLSVCGTAAAQDDAGKALLAAHRGAIVQIQVRGKINNKPAFENGTGFLFQTAAGPRIITAGHVIGPDNKWDSLVDRCIYYRLAQNGSSLQYDCVVDARIDPTLDIAEIYLDPFDAPTLEMAQSLPTNGAGAPNRFRLRGSDRALLMT